MKRNAIEKTSDDSVPCATQSESLKQLLGWKRIIPILAIILVVLFAFVYAFKDYYIYHKKLKEVEDYREFISKTNPEYSSVLEGIYRINRTEGTSYSSYFGKNNFVLIDICTFKNFYSLDSNEIKNMLRTFGNAYVDYSISKKYDNDYYLIFSTNFVAESVVYDFEEDILYLSNYYPVLKETYDKFGTIDEQDILKIPGGESWLIKNNFGEMKHKEYNSFYISHQGFNVYISQDGELHEYDENESTTY